MKKYLSCILLLCFCKIHAQSINVDDPRTVSSTQVFVNNIMGVPYQPVKYYRFTEGSMYVPENFSPSVLFFRDGKNKYAKIMARLNIVENQIHFLNEKGKEMISNIPVEEIYFTDTLTNTTKIYVHNIPFHQNNKEPWYEVLEKGKVSLYREIDKYISETKVYGQATLEYKVVTSYVYWLVMDNSAKKMRHINELTALLNSLNPAFKAPSGSQKWSDKKNEDWVKLVEIFNGLN